VRATRFRKASSRGGRTRESRRVRRRRGGSTRRVSAHSDASLMSLHMVSSFSRMLSDSPQCIYESNRLEEAHPTVQTDCTKEDGTGDLSSPRSGPVAMSPCFFQSSHSAWLEFSPPLAENTRRVTAAPPRASDDRRTDRSRRRSQPFSSPHRAPLGRCPGPIYHLSRTLPQTPPFITSTRFRLTTTHPPLSSPPSSSDSFTSP
jgi:hypothetical protein